MADLIERFLQDRLAYPQEWNDFVDTSQRSAEMDGYRKICYAIDPSVNCQGQQDDVSLDELRKIIERLRR